MPRWPLVLFLLLARCASADGDLPVVESIAFYAETRGAGGLPRYDPLVFWTTGASERVIVRVRLSSHDASSSVRVVLAVKWGLLPAGAPLRDDDIVWSEAEGLGGFDIAVPEGGFGDVLASIPIARRSIEWGEEGLEVVSCRVRVRVGDEETIATLAVIPAER